MRTIPVSVLMLALASMAHGADLGGQQLFEQHCATCHGALARGDGPMAEILSVPVPDLTVLAAGNDGIFPILGVIAVIDGRTRLQGHGGPMPIFGPILGGGSGVLDGPDGSIVQTRGDILAIARWLESLQR